MSWFVVYLDKDLKYKYLMDLNGFIQAKDLPNYAKFNPLIEQLNFTGTGDQNLTTMMLKDANNKDMRVSMTSIGYQRRSNDDFVEWLKIGFVIPESKMLKFVEGQI
jgi:hypothetical protein